MAPQREIDSAQELRPHHRRWLHLGLLGRLANPTAVESLSYAKNATATVGSAYTPQAMNDTINHARVRSAIRQADIDMKKCRPHPQ